MFPIGGETEEEMKSSLREFFAVKLKIPTADMLDEDVVHVRRVRQRRGRDNLGEVIVVFSGIEARDRVTSYARNLGQYVDSKGKPTAGIRFEIPDHLTGVHKCLLQYAHALWVKHGKDPDFKRNVRFNDADMSFSLDVKLPGKLKWMTVSHERASKERKASINNDEEDKLLSLGESPPVVEGSEDEGRGRNAAGGSVTLTSWRAPNGR